jgi:hypothetical protein
MLEGTEGVIKKPWIEEVQTVQWSKLKGSKGQTMIYKALHSKLKIKQWKLQKPWADSGATNGLAVPVPLLTV